MGANQSTEKGDETAQKRSDAKNSPASTLANRLQRSRAAHLSKVLRAETIVSDQADGDDSVPQTKFCGSSPELIQTALQVDPKDYQFPFENLVFEGGGNKGMAYAGLIRCLDECGVLGQIHRYAGTSAGAITAAMLACGFSGQELQGDIFKGRLDDLLLDARFGVFSLIPNLVGSYGWHPGHHFYDKLGDMLKEKTGDADITFQQLYHQTGRELCVMVTNLNQMNSEYCHPKTTPNMPIRLAVRMSIAIPVLFSAVKLSATEDWQDVLVDGGVLCNYPVHCFDGWYLSMNPDDTFLKRLQPLCAIPHLMDRNQRFGTTNEKTLGIILYGEDDSDYLRMGLEKRYICREPLAPTEKTKLLKNWEKERKRKSRAEREHDKIVKAIDAFLAVLNKHNIRDKDVIDIDELKAAFEDKAGFPDEQAEVLFGQDFTVEEVFALLDYDHNGQIQFGELVRFIESTGVDLHTFFMGVKRQNIDGFLSFLNSLQNTLVHNVQKLHVKDCDIERSIGINTGYVGTTDFTLEDPDIQFLHERGYNSTKAFLQYYVAKHPDKVQRKPTSTQY